MRQRIFTSRLSPRDLAERGAAMFLMAMMILIVLIGGALAIDLSITTTRGQTLQNAADSAALAGVQALRENMGTRTVATEDDRQAARVAVDTLLAQNGITDITPVVEFPDPTNDTEVRVSIRDDDPGRLLSGVTGANSGIEREATARFERCESGCIQEIEIPPPFRAVDAFGQGDGYKPIPVGNRLYALNHNSGAGQIVCVDREEDGDDPTDPENDGFCWDEAAKLAYPSNFRPPATPEMPSTAVIGSRIFWAVSSNAGTHLYCFETITATPCPNPYLITGNRLNTNNSSRTAQRAGGTFTPDQTYVYTFTDDNRVHCIWPHEVFNNSSNQWIFVMDPCPNGGYGSTGVTTGLGMLRNDKVEPDLTDLSGNPAHTWPAGDPDEGNHGSSIDRIYDPVENRVYHTLHLDWAPPTGPPQYCANLDNDTDPRGVVTLKNARSGLFMAVNSLGELVDGTDAEDPGSQWQVLTGVFRRGRVFVFRNELNGKYLSLSGNYPVWGEPLQLVDNFDYNDSIFQIIDLNTVSQLRTYDQHNDGSGAWDRLSLREEAVVDPVDPNIVDIEFTANTYGSPSDPAANWIVRPAECDLPDRGPETFQGVAYEQGTFIDCFDLDQHKPCSQTSDFLPSKIHNDWDSFSGRLFFYMTSGSNPVPQGVCSTGFTENWEWRDMSSFTELACVDINDGSERGDLELSMPQFVSALAETNKGDTGDGWGTWGDPHYNAHTNRIFYPTQRAKSRVLCWDFDDGWCGERQAFSALGEIQDYGFFSEQNCVFGLGHRAIFWAFKADNIFEDCSGSSTTSPIHPCDCGGKLFWGTLVFDVDLAEFDSFEITLHDAPDQRGNRVYPPENWIVDPGATSHSLHRHGDTIDLNSITPTSEDQQLWVTVTVEAEGDPWANGDQKFTLEFERTPRLVG